MPTLEDLKAMQSMPLSTKIMMSRQRIKAWIDEYGEENVAVSFSGGKDSTVLLDLVRMDYPNIRATFVNTGLEYPEVRQFAMSKNVEVLKPTMVFNEVIKKYGYPFISKEVSQAVYYTRKFIDKYNLRKDGICSKEDLKAKLIELSSIGGGQTMREDLCQFQDHQRK